MEPYYNILLLYNNYIVNKMQRNNIENRPRDLFLIFYIQLNNYRLLHLELSTSQMYSPSPLGTQELHPPCSHSSYRDRYHIHPIISTNAKY